MEISKAMYYGQEVSLVGNAQRLEMEGGQMHFQMQITGSPSEAVLQAHTSDPTKSFRVHKCPQDCALLETGDHYLHGLRGRLILQEDQMPHWGKNLVGVEGPAMVREDELAALRRRTEELREAAPEGRGDAAPEEKKEKKREKKDKKEKKRKKDAAEEEEDYADGRHPQKAAVRPLSTVFPGTGMDPVERVRQRVLRAARRYLDKKDKKKDSSSSSNSNGSSSDSKEKGAPMDGLFTESSKARRITEKYPGVLCAEAMQTMQEALLLDQGEDISSTSVRPVALMYYKQNLSKKASGAASRELLNISAALDALAKGRIAHCGDILAQRLKSCEAVLLGSHYSVAQRMEVPVQEGSAIAGQQELRLAQQENYREGRTKYLASTGSQRKPEEPRGKGGKQGKNDKGRDDRGRPGKGKDSKGKDNSAVDKKQ